MNHGTAIANTIRLIMISAMLCLCKSAFSVHLDVEVWGQDDRLHAGFCRTPGIVGCDLGGLLDDLNLPASVLPVQASTGKLIFLADFGDLTGGTFKTRNPGFQSVQNALFPNELLSYRALGSLHYWNPAQSEWTDPPQEQTIALYGGLELKTEQSTDLSQCSGLLLCFDEDSFGTDGKTVFSSKGILGNSELVVDITDRNGILHTHLSFFLESQEAQLGGPVGAYLIEMQVLSNARSIPSDPFFILFNAGLDPSQFAQALQSLIGDTDNNEAIIPPRNNEQVSFSIPGDVDLDGDVDRIDVALILLAAQNNSPVQSDNAWFDIDGDQLITREDAQLAKTLCSLRLCHIPVSSSASVLNVLAIFNAKTEQLGLNEVRFNDEQFQVQLKYVQKGQFLLESAQAVSARYALPANFDIDSGLLDIPSVYVDRKFYHVTLRFLGNSTFQLETIEQIQAVVE